MELGSETSLPATLRPMKRVYGLCGIVDRHTDKGERQKDRLQLRCVLFFEEKMLTPSFESSLDHVAILLLLDMHLTILILSFLIFQVKTIIQNCVIIQ